MKAVSVLDISKKFNIGSEKDQGALARLVSFASDCSAKKEIQVLRNVSLEIFPGEIFGLIGKNGSGKSTLLRIIASIYYPDSGQVFTTGRVDYLSGLNVGLNPRLTMKENIILMGSIIGLSRKEISGKFDEIVEFSELPEFVSTKVYKFSSGMVTRLQFSTFMHCLSCRRADVLLLDEVFDSGGDISFERKAAEKISEVVGAGAAVIMASHDLQIIKSYCTKVIRLEAGEIADQGKPKDVVEKYINLCV